MTVKEILAEGKRILLEFNIDNYANESRWIFESVFDCSSDYIYFNSDAPMENDRISEYFDKINKRASGIPVQYVIGEWEFYGETFYVGNGVLIPRPETELLVDFAVNYLKDKSNPVVFDLCSGSGCIGLTVAKRYPEAKVFLLEKSDDALKYLLKNKEHFSLSNVEVIHGDLFDGFENFNLPAPVLILSNPPYINSGEIAALQSEVLKEPFMALDGGIDGLDFYKAISEKWLSDCCGAIAVECGEGQADDIKKLFSHQCSDLISVTDFNGIERVVVGRKDLQ